MRVVSKEKPRLERIERLEELRDSWDGLAEGSGHPFGTWEWLETWWRYFGEGRELYTFACFDRDDRLAAILPMYVAGTRPLRVARFMGYADLHSPLCAPADRPLAAAALLASIGPERHGCRLLMAERLPGEQGWGELLGGRLLRTTPDPVLRVEGGSWDAFLAAKSRKFRSGVRRTEKVLIRDHGLRFRLTEDPEALPADIDVLYRLHADRFGDEASGFFEDRRGEMQREVMTRAFERGWLRLWIAEVDGVPAAVYYGWRYAGSEFFVQSGRDARFERLSVGSALLAHVIRGAFDDGMREFRFLVGDESYKLRYADGDHRPETRVIGSGAVGSVAALGLRAVDSLPVSVRSRVVRSAG